MTTNPHFEEMMNGIIPKTFTHWVNCEKCGLMKVPPHNGPKDMQVKSCVWCEITSYDFRIKGTGRIIHGRKI